MGTINTMIAVPLVQCFATRLGVLLGRDMAGCCRRGGSGSNVNDLYSIIILLNISATMIYPNRVSFIVNKYIKLIMNNMILLYNNRKNTSVFILY